VFGSRFGRVEENLRLCIAAVKFVRTGEISATSATLNIIPPQIQAPITRKEAHCARRHLPQLIYVMYFLPFIRAKRRQGTLRGGIGTIPG
jgi:hypothetical protein